MAEIKFYSGTCQYLYTTDSSIYTAEKAAEDLTAMGWQYDGETLKVTLPENLGRVMITAIIYGEGDTEATLRTLSFLYADETYGPGDQAEELISSGIDVQMLTGGVEYSRTLTEEEKTNLNGFYVDFILTGEPGEAGMYALSGSGQLEDDGGTDEETEATPQYIYPTGTIPFKALLITPVGFKNHQSAEAYTHIRMFVAEIQDDGTVGGDGHVWQSDPYEKDVDRLAMLGALRPMCEGHALTNFNVTYVFVKENEAGEYEYVDSYIVGDATNAVTFSVSDEVDKPVISLEDVVYCLGPVLLSVNRLTNRDIQNVRVEVSNYIADFEFYPDRNLLEIDIAEYLQTLWANVDVFDYQQMQTTVVVKLYDADWDELQVQGINVTSIYGKQPDPALPESQLRVQWLDKYGYLHDEYFKIVENTTEGESKQKYVSNREDREDKTGEKSITLAYVGANATQKEALKTLVFADHIRAYIGEAWKRVKIANTYKTGKGRVTANFEFTIKYAL